MTKTISTFANDRITRPSRTSEHELAFYTHQEDKQIITFVLEHQKLDAKSNTDTPIPFHILSLPGRDATSISSRWKTNLSHRLQTCGTLLECSLGVTLRNQMRTNQKVATKYYDSVPDDKLIEGDDARMSSPDAQDMGCIETSYEYINSRSGYRHKSYNTDQGSAPGIYLHIAACVSKHGPKPAPKSKSAGDAYTASHVCQNDRCINREHICWETLGDNLSRRQCVGYCRFVKGDESVLVKINECNHKPRCMNFVTVEL